jgi:hypothetical protein
MIKLANDYKFSPEIFSLHNYPWVFDENSKNYIDLQMGIIKILNNQNLDLNKCISLKEDTNKLIKVIKIKLKRKY